MATIAELILNALQRHGIDNLYCLPGVQNDDFFDALYDRRASIRTVVTRHEQGAAYMAMGAAMATGQPQIYCAVPGQGLLNASAAHSTAYAVSARVLALIGQIPAAYEGKGYGLLHELPDQMAVLEQISKHCVRLLESSQAADQIGKAFASLIGGDAKPVSVDVPMNLWRCEAGPDKIDRIDAPAVDLDGINDAADLLSRSRTPIIFVGSGAAACSQEVTRLAEMLEAPVASYRQGRGIISDRHDLAITLPIAHRLWPNADLALGIGTRMHYPLLAWGVDEALTTIQISTDAQELKRRVEPNVKIFSSAEAALPPLIEALGKRLGKREARRPMIQDMKATHGRELSYLEPQLSYLRAIRDVLPDDGIFVDDITQVSFAARLALPIYQPRSFLTAGYAGTLGFGYAAALGAQHALPCRKVVSVQGDGGFMFTSNEIATAVKYRIPLTALVFNDGAYGNVRRTQVEQYRNRVIASDLVNPDFVKYAESFGALGLRADSPDDLRKCLEKSFAQTSPAVIEIPVAPMPSPWKHLMLSGGRRTADPHVFP